MFAIQILGAVGPTPNAPKLNPETDYYVQEYYPDAFSGRGSVTTTENIFEALRFDSVGAAWDCWRQQSSVRPLRADGAPNRPLTSFSVTIVSIPDSGEAFYKNENFVRKTARAVSREEVRAAAERAAAGDEQGEER